MNKSKPHGVMLNVYPDSIGGTLKNLISLLKHQEFINAIDSLYILPSVFNSDLDRGFSVIDYSLNRQYANDEDISEIKQLGINLKFDFVLNHLSVLSPQFQDLIRHGRESKYKDFFINWNDFWNGKGELGNDGVLIPDDIYLQKMFFRKPSLPILMVRFPDKNLVPYWNTFYQEIKYPNFDSKELMENCEIDQEKANMVLELIDRTDGAINIDDLAFLNDSQKTAYDYIDSQREYLGQMDLNIESDLVWDFYKDTIHTLASYGAKIIRLDAFAYSSKVPGKKNFFNIPETWNDLEKVNQIAKSNDLVVLPEIHASYEEKRYLEISKKGYLTYDFFLPGLVLDAIETRDPSYLVQWGKEVISKRISTVNMLGCHDGIPVLDLVGLLPNDRIESLINLIVKRGGYIKNLHGKKNIYYQVNATYFSALGEDQQKLTLARAIQMFMPGKPQVWYLDLFAGTNDYEALERGGAGSHKEINRTNLSIDQVFEQLNLPVVQEQIKLLKMRNTHPAFNVESDIRIEQSNHSFDIAWSYQRHEAHLTVDLENKTYSIILT
jgi:sucrose phosphorylase